MTIRELVKNEIDMLPDDALYAVRDFMLSQEKHPKMSREAVFGCMRGQFCMADDFDAPLEDFKEYME